ncbi:hypothetical protein HOLleu_04287 [Holothuria leucospilota]|uniref:Uncharacterized protein n=1 Tax=Holothuria leucospilota TaxID=206669 RepID=A0A9Q1HMA6_HOLLE|nr:hypothetical protein HOLleu_04287 [Holothuria leucospilota]
MSFKTGGSYPAISNLMIDIANDFNLHQIVKEPTHMYSIKVEAEDSPIWEEKRSETTITSRIKQENFVEEAGDNIVSMTDAASSHLIAEGRESGTNKEETSDPSHEKGVDGVTWQVNVHLECDEDMVQTTENVTDAIVDKDSEDEGMYRHELFPRIRGFP